VSWALGLFDAVLVWVEQQARPAKPRAATRSNLKPVELDTWLCPFTVQPAALNFAR
jgi:hypothetical protein